MAQDDLEFIRAVRSLNDAAKRLNAGADKLFDGQKLTDTVFNKIGLGQARDFQKKASEFLNQRKLRRQQEREVRQRLGGKDPISKATLKQLKNEAELTKKKEAVDAAFKSFVETNLGLNEQLLDEIRYRQNLKEDRAGNLRGEKGRFVSTPENFLKKTVDETAFNRQFVDKMGFAKQNIDAKSPGDRNVAAEEERRSDQQAFEMEKTESTNDILRDILAALTDNSPLKKDEKNNSGLLAGLGLANLLGSLGKLGKLLLLGSPLLLGIAGLTYGLSELSDMADEITKKVVDDTKKQTKAIEDAKTAEQAKEATTGKAAQINAAELNRQTQVITSATEKKALSESSADLGEAKLRKAEEFEIVKNSQSFNDIIKNSAMIFGAARDASIRDGNTIEARYASFDKVLAETIAKIKGSKTFLDADEKTQSFMIGQVVAQANKALAGAAGKSRLLYGLSPEAMKGQAGIETTRARALAALAGGRGKFAEEGFGYLSDRLGGGRNIFSKSQVESLEARVSEARKDADEVSFFERNLGSNQGDIDRLNSLTKELARLRDAIATVGSNTVVAPNNSVNTVNNSSATVSTPITITDPNMQLYDMF
jgi:hypothetical protein